MESVRTPLRATKRPAVCTEKTEPYSPSLGSVAMNLNGQWVVVAPNGRIQARYGVDEAGARSYALYVNTTSVKEEREAWATR
jgi:hypothetical protein